MQSIVAHVSESVVHIQTQNGWGTGFIFWQNDELCAIATADHVISSANIEGWEQPIYISQPNGNVAPAYPTQRHIISKLEGSDTAAILIDKNTIKMPNSLLPLRNDENLLQIGNRIGWLGYPKVVPNTVFSPSFFSGHISNINHSPVNHYFIDGVVIHGTSGGPVFTIPDGNDGVQIIGCINFYHPDVSQNEIWPGLAVSHSVSCFKPLLEHWKTLEDAKSKAT